MNFKKYNRLLGFFTGFCAFIVYSLTVEPTASYWDCAEYISTSAKLQIGHPPGAPLFQMLGAVFAILAIENTQIAYAINMMSVTSSALTIVFMFWSVSLLSKKILKVKNEISSEESFKIFGAAFLTTFTFMFTDSFWFNAVEAEVYAMATLILSVLFWLALKWEQEMNTEYGDRWLLMISFVIGLSFGVHFMGLLTIPAIGMIYFFKNTEKITFKNFLLSNLISVAILLFIFKLLLPSTLAIFGEVEVYFVNNLNLPFNSGTIFTGVIILLFFYYGLKYTSQKNWVNINTSIL